MTIDQIAIFIIIIFTFTLFVWGKWRYDIVSIISLCTLFITDLLFLHVECVILGIKKVEDVA